MQISLYKQPQPRGYINAHFLVEDRSSLSPLYFDITQLPQSIGGGRSVIVFKGNGENLALNSSIDVEVVDAAGKNVYCEFANFIDRFNQYYLVLEIYDITSSGPATICLVGKATRDLSGQPINTNYRAHSTINYHLEYDVCWKGSVIVQATDRNNADLIFDDPPHVGVAQVYGPARVQTQATASGFVYKTVTSSIDQLTIVSTDFVGYDRDFSTSPKIRDPRMQSLLINPKQLANTENTVNTTLRKKDTDIVGGYRISQTERFNTRILASSSFFRKEYLGGCFEFYDSGSTPQNLTPSPPSGIEISGSLQQQLIGYQTNIVEVINDRQAVLADPVEITTLDNRHPPQQYISTFRYKQASNFSGSITYAPSDITYAESIFVSQSYLEFTLTNLKPISGEIYRIRTYTKRGASTGDFKLLNDQVIRSVEYLTDASFPNATSYAKSESDYQLIGHFTTQSVVDNYWNLHKELPDSFDLISGSVASDVLINSVELHSTYTQSCVLAARYNQNYDMKQVYTLSVDLVLDPYTEVEVYMSSTPLNYNIVAPALYPQAFLRDPMTDTRSVPGVLWRRERRNVLAYSAFGKQIGKVTNDSSVRKHYGRVVFDFETDGSGFGRPVLRSRVVDETPTISGSAYVADLSIKPHKLNGFTPTILQFSVPLTVELATFFSVISQSIDLKLEYYDYTGRQSEYVTRLDDVTINLKGEVPSNTCQAETNLFTYSTQNTGELTRRQITNQASQAK